MSHIIVNDKVNSNDRKIFFNYFVSFYSARNVNFDLQQIILMYFYYTLCMCLIKILEKILITFNFLFKNVFTIIEIFVEQNKTI